jgi:RNA polymerase sigma factor (sigma-70 family)
VGAEMKVSPKTARLFLSGDKEAWAEVYEAYRRILFFLIASIVNNPEDAKDLLSETFIKAREHASSIRDPKALDSYLTKSALHLSYDFLSAKKENVSYDSVEEILGEESHDNYYLQELNSFLSDRENLVVTLIVLYGYSLRETATLLSISKSEAHLLYHSALRKLKAAYQGQRRPPHVHS